MNTRAGFVYGLSFAVLSRFGTTGVLETDASGSSSSYLVHDLKQERAMAGTRDLKERTRKFAVRIVHLCRSLPRTAEGKIIGSQLLRCGTSVGANYRAVSRARSRAEFAAKLGIVVEEADEAVFWLELLIDSGIFSRERLQDLLAEANELVAIFVASRQTTMKQAVAADE
jgi:four helix bundle protein